MLHYLSVFSSHSHLNSLWPDFHFLHSIESILIKITYSPYLLKPWNSFLFLHIFLIWVWYLTLCPPCSSFTFPDWFFSTGISLTITSCLFQGFLFLCPLNTVLAQIPGNGSFFSHSQLSNWPPTFPWFQHYLDSKDSQIEISAQNSIWAPYLDTQLPIVIWIPHRSLKLTIIKPNALFPPPKWGFPVFTLLVIYLNRMHYSPPT